jgi:cytochrome c5
MTGWGLAPLLIALAPACLADNGENVYRLRCSLCHDSGATAAPRVGQPGDWRQRIGDGREGLLRSAREGLRGTAMLPRAGFPDLGDDELAACAAWWTARRSCATPRAPR